MLNFSKVFMQKFWTRHGSENPDQCGSNSFEWMRAYVFPQIGQFEAKLALINFVLRLKLKGGTVAEWP